MRFEVDIQRPDDARCAMNGFLLVGCDAFVDAPAVLTRSLSWNEGKPHETWEVVWVCYEHRGGVIPFALIDESVAP